MEARWLLTAGAAPSALIASSVPVQTQALAVNGSLVAAFVDTADAAPASHYTAAIDWGDGSSPSAGTIVGDSVSTTLPVLGTLSVGSFYVTGSHAYAASGAFNVTVTIFDSDGSQATVNGHAHIGPDPTNFVAHGVGAASQGLTLAGTIVAAFADGVAADPISNYSAVIDWGDGSSPTAGTIAGNSGTVNVPLIGVLSGGGFIVTGSHTYAASGDYQLTIAITDADGSQATVQSQANVGQVNNPPPSGEVLAYVAKAFDDVFHRVADAAGLSFWSQQISGGLAPAQFAAELTHSAEFYASNVVNPDYQKYLGRAADAAGTAYWTTQMQQGLTDQQLGSDLIGSNEFYTQAGGTDLAWVDALYQTVLGRGPDYAGQSYWLGQLATGASRASVAAGFAASAESEAQIIQQDYFSYLGRSAGPAEVNYWVRQFEQGQTNENIVSGFVGSSEFAKLNS